jgi:hypothetical protein
VETGGHPYRLSDKDFEKPLKMDKLEFQALTAPTKFLAINLNELL